MTMMREEVIPFFKPTVIHDEWNQMKEIDRHPELLHQKVFSNKVTGYLRQHLGRSVYLTKSCTQALELSALLPDIRQDDEVIMPSFAFVSCANAFTAKGARLVFVDVRPDTMNIDEQLIEAAVTPRTRAIVTINYSGVGCEYDSIKKVAERYSLLLVEDNAHGILASYRGMPLGTFGDASAFSFDHLKNITCGQGGAIALNEKFIDKRWEYYYEFGTNKAEFIRAESVNYEWKSQGSNCYLSEILSAFLYAQLLHAEEIIAKFRARWNDYMLRLKLLETEGIIRLPFVPPHCEHNAHNFFIRTRSPQERASLIAFLKEHGITATFHYVPLHSSEFGRQRGRFHGADRFTTAESGRLLRLPLFYDLTADDIDRICSRVFAFYGVKYA